MAKLPDPEYERKFGPRTSAAEVLRDVPTLEGKTFLITGTTAGIGVETARALLLKKAHVVLANRSISKSESLKEKFLLEIAGAKIDLIHTDLSSLQSVRAAAKQFLSKGWPLHGLILNAGVFSPPQPVTIDGYNCTFGVNHLAHFYLTILLKEKLIESAPSRVVIVSSSSHRHSMIKATLPTNEKIEKLIMSLPSKVPVQYVQYATSKLCNVLFAMKLHRELTGTGVNVYVLHPGNMIATDIGRRFGVLNKVFNAIARPFTKTVEQGAATTVFCAVSPDVENTSGKYYESCWEEECSPLACDQELQDALWDESQNIIRKFEETNQS